MQLNQAAPLPLHRTAWLAVLGFWVAVSLMILAPGDLILTSHWGDALHLVDILERMTQGQRPHMDFVTPLGELAFMPIVALIEAGLPTGRAYLVAQILVAGLVGMAALAVGLNRLPWTWATVCAGTVILIALALVHGRPEVSLSINVHYNRWGWSIAMAALLAALLPPMRATPWDGVWVGVSLAALALIKITFFVAVLPLVVLGFILTGQARSLVLAGVIGAGIALGLTLIWGVDYWVAYARDVLYVAGAGARPNAGHGVLSMLTDPWMLAPAALAVVASLIFYWQGAHRSLVLFACTFLMGACISNQNAGHDPLFLGLIALLLAVWAQELHGIGRTALQVGALVMIASIAPNLYNLASSPVRAALADRAAYVPLVTGRRQHQDLMLLQDAASGRGQTYLVNDSGAALATFDFKGETLVACQSQVSPAYFAAIADDLAQRDLVQGKPLFVADYLSPLWLFGDHQPLPGAAPWSYGGTHGIEQAEYVLVPECPNRLSVHWNILAALEDTPLTEVVRTPLYRLYVR